MSLSFMLPLTLVTMYLVTCNATADSDPTKISTIGSPDFVRSLDAGQNDGAAGGRFLRVHDGGEEEERGLNFSLTEMMNKRAAKKMAKAILKDPNMATAAYTAWQQKGYRMDTILKWLEVADPKSKNKYLQIYNGYVSHLDM